MLNMFTKVTLTFLFHIKTVLYFFISIFLILCSVSRGYRKLTNALQCISDPYLVVHVYIPHGYEIKKYRLRWSPSFTVLSCIFYVNCLKVNISLSVVVRRLSTITLKPLPWHR